MVDGLVDGAAADALIPTTNDEHEQMLKQLRFDTELGPPHRL